MIQTLDWEERNLSITVGYLDWHTSEEGQWVQLPKRCTNNIKDEDNSGSSEWNEKLHFPVWTKKILHQNVKQNNKQVVLKSNKNTSESHSVTESQYLQGGFENVES